MQNYPGIICMLRNYPSMFRILQNYPSMFSISQPKKRISIMYHVFPPARGSDMYLTFCELQPSLIIYLFIKTGYIFL